MFSKWDQILDVKRYKDGQVRSRSCLRMAIKTKVVIQTLFLTRFLALLTEYLRRLWTLKFANA